MLQKHATRRHSAEVIWQLENLFWMSLQLNPTPPHPPVNVNVLVCKPLNPFVVKYTKIMVTKLNMNGELRTCKIHGSGGGGNSVITS